MHDKITHYKLWRVGLLQWIFFIALGAGLPFFGLYYKEVLVDANGQIAHYYIGIVLFFQSILGIFASPIAGIISDKFKIENRVLTFCSLMIFFGAILISLPGFTIFSDWDLRRKFFFIVSGAAMRGLFYTPVLPLIDTETLNYLHEKYNNNSRYGNIRVLGSIGWIMSTIFIGLLLHKISNLSIAVLGYAFGFFILGMIALSGVRTKIEVVKIPWSHLKNDRVYQKFLLFIFFFTFGFSSSFIFTSYFMDDANVSYLIIGLSFGLSALPEIPLMFYAKTLLKKIGNRWMIILGAFIEFLKLVCFVLVIKLGLSHIHFLFILIQGLHGIGFTFLYNGEINLIDRQSHKDLRATYQNLFHLVWAISTAFGGIFASFIIKYLSSTWLMGIDGGIIFLSILFFIFFVRGHGPEETNFNSHQ